MKPKLQPVPVKYIVQAKYNAGDPRPIGWVVNELWSTGSHLYDFKTEHEARLFAAIAQEHAETLEAKDSILAKGFWLGVIFVSVVLGILALVVGRCP